MSSVTWFREDFVLLPSLRECEVWIPVYNKSRCTKSWHNSRSRFSKLQLASGFPDHCSFNFDANAVKMLLLLIKICFQKILHEWKMVGGICVMEDWGWTCMGDASNEMKRVKHKSFLRTSLQRGNTIYLKRMKGQRVKCATPFPCGGVKGYLWVWKSRSASWRYAQTMALISWFES